jgi:hypothetical protein
MQLMENFQLAQVSAPSFVGYLVQRRHGLRHGFVELGEVGVDEAYGLRADADRVPCLASAGK